MSPIPCRTLDCVAEEPDPVDVIAQAMGFVSVQADCTVDEALTLIDHRAQVSHSTILEIAEAVADGSIRFDWRDLLSTGRDATRTLSAQLRRTSESPQIRSALRIWPPALAWLDGARAAGASFDAHQIVR